MSGGPALAHTVASAAAGLVSHTCTVSSSAAASWPPAGAKATPVTSPPAACSVAVSAGRAGSRTFHSHTLPSLAPAASVAPSGLNMADRVGADAVSGPPSGTG